jgi:hypothetical protein
MKLCAIKEAGLEGSAGRKESICMHYHENAGQNHNKSIHSKCFENVANLKYFWQDSNKSKLHSQRNKNMLNLGNAC